MFLIKTERTNFTEGAYKERELRAIVENQDNERHKPPSLFSFNLSTS